MAHACPRRGFTLVELLIVIAIIATLIALLLPAVQSARESARRSQCGNNLKQLAMGSLQHVQSQGFFPSGGWGWNWTGDADRSFGRTQPGGWAYHVLPFIEQTGLFQMGAGLSDTDKRAANGTRAATAVPTFYCASRRTAQPFPYSAGGNALTNGNTPGTFGKTDYALNGGTVVGNLPPGPGSSCLTGYPNCQSGCSGGTPDDWYCDFTAYTGLIHHRSEVTPASITDGASQTLMIAEKYLNPDSYVNGSDGADNGDAWEGYDWDTVRWTERNSFPVQDTPGLYPMSTRFGSAHALSFMTAACDGSVRAVAYTISPTIWASLGHRKDNVTANWK